MRLKSFHGATLTEAMRLIRDTLGDNAIIVATRNDDMGGVRVTAAIDDAYQAKTQGTAATSEKIAESTGSEVIEIIAEALLRHQVPTSLAERLLASATQFANDDPVLALGAAFDTHLQFKPLPEGNCNKPLIFIGAPGAGKTLCVAKLATKAVLGKKSVSVISTDTERAGGMEQLAVFTRLLKINLIEIEDAHALKDAMEIKPPEAFALIDTPGRNPFITSEKQQLQSLITACDGEAILVMPADMDALEAIDMAQEFKSIGASSLLFTRLDMTRRLGGILRTAFETRMPLANYSLSHKVTEPPQPFNPITLAKLVLPQQTKTSAKPHASENTNAKRGAR
ncbi:MAG: GTPase [Alphaproteobacteria bacterium]|nr:GTPase [Alphaproteobacteria bacterium]